MFYFSKNSLNNLKNVHPKIIAIVFEVLKEMDITIVEGQRSIERQKVLLANGKSKTLNSKHIIKDGEIYCRAVDIIPPSGWSDIGELQKMGALIKKAANELNIKIRWGGDWSWKDYAHFELNNNEV